MAQFDILDKKDSHVHFIGIGGISMSGLALILANLGFKVSGSDIKSTNITEQLTDKGIKIYIGHDQSNIKGSDIIVHTAAIKEDNPEMIKAKELGLPIIERSVLLGEIMKKYQYSIGISGTHGKTTTTSMVSLSLLNAGYDPTITVGGELESIGGNLKIGNSQYFVTEACEYVESFLKFHPYIAIILNIDEDHLDYYKDINEIAEAFLKYAKLVPNDGYLIINNDDPRKDKIIDNVACNKVTFGINNTSDYQAVNICFNELGFPNFDVLHADTLLGKVQLNIPGTHNIYNSLASVACSMKLGINFETCKNSLLKFKGAKRRFEIKGKINNATIIDDYAHHPTEISATLKAADKYPHNKIWCIFQPHTYSRTKALLGEFSEAFCNADKIIITDIYAAREKNTFEIHSKDLVAKLQDNKKDAIYIKDFDEIYSFIKQNFKENDLIITMGAGDIYKVGEMLLSKDAG